MKKFVEIGRCRAVLVSNVGKAITSTIIVKSTVSDNRSKIVFHGEVIFDNALQDHIRNIILPQIKEILLKLLKKEFIFEISALNIGAASSSNSTLSISGNSCDLSIYSAMLSSALKIPINQHKLFTGNIASEDGDIIQVENLKAKLKAAVKDNEINCFIFPDIQQDLSLQTAKPHHYKKLKKILSRNQSTIKLVPISKTLDVTKEIFSEVDIAISSLKFNYFNKEVKNEQNSNNKLLLDYFLYNETKFWSLFSSYIEKSDIKICQSLLGAFFDFHISSRKYPSRIGYKMTKTVESLPHKMRFLLNQFLLIDQSNYVKLIQFSTDRDKEDISLLHNSLYNNRRSGFRISEHDNFKTFEKDELLVISGYLLEQIQPEKIKSLIISPHNALRRSFKIEKNKKITLDLYSDTVKAFYLHVNQFKNTGSKNAELAMKNKALPTTEKSFVNIPHYGQTVSRVLLGDEDAWEVVLNNLTDYLINKKWEDYFMKIVDETIDSRRTKLKNNLIRELVAKNGRLSNYLKNFNTIHFIKCYLEIIREYYSTIEQFDSSKEVSR